MPIAGGVGAIWCAAPAPSATEPFAGRGGYCHGVTSWTPSSLDDLFALEAVKQLKYRYLRYLDQRLWTEMAGIFTVDAVATYGGGAYAFEGRDAILGFLRKNMGREDFLSSHRCHQPEISFASSDIATGVWAFDDEVIMGEWNLTVRGAGFYEDEYRRGDDGEWRIARTGYKRSFEQMYPLDSISGLRITASWWATDGRSELPA